MVSRDLISEIPEFPFEPHFYTSEKIAQDASFVRLFLHHILHFISHNTLLITIAVSEKGPEIFFLNMSRNRFGWGQLYMSYVQKVEDMRL